MLSQEGKVSNSVLAALSSLSVSPLCYVKANHAKAEEGK